MALNEKQERLLKQLPGVDSILLAAQQDDELSQVPKRLLTDSIRMVIERLRTAILEQAPALDEKILDPIAVLGQLKTVIRHKTAYQLRHVINATGVVVHTNLGRSLLADEALDRIVDVSRRYSNLEFDVGKGRRGLRYSHVEDILCEISGAEAGMVVNNNAAAVLLCLETLAREREVIVSRGELVEIGGAFRIPDVMRKSGAILSEVGTTNRTHLKDYETAINGQTAMLLKVHTSNYAIIGFTKAVALEALVALGASRQLIVMEDLGSGTFVDFTNYGLSREPTVQASVKAGADVVTFSGDKLLGGPQAGIILGKKEIVEQIRQNPLNRALRIDKMTLAALEGTLRLYRDEKTAVGLIPTLRMLTLPMRDLEARAQKLYQMLQSLNISGLTVFRLQQSSRAGGGSLPQLKLPTICIGLKVAGESANMIEKSMRDYSPPIIGRIDDDIFMIDIRTVQDDELITIVNAIEGLLKKGAL